MATEPGPAGEDPRTDPELLRAHVHGDSDAFGLLFRRHRARLWAVALRTMGDPEDAADGLQDGMIAAYRRAASYRGDAQVTTWLHRVVVNACLDRVRASKGRRAEALPEDFDGHGARGSLTVAPAPVEDPADVSVRSERRAEVLAALRTLPAEQRAALVLVDMEGYSVTEAADILNCPVGTVKSRCSRGRRRLVGLLEHLMGGATGDEDHHPPGNPDTRSPVRSEKASRAPPTGEAPGNPA